MCIKAILKIIQMKTQARQAIDQAISMRVILSICAHFALTQCQHQTSLIHREIKLVKSMLTFMKNS